MSEKPLNPVKPEEDKEEPQNSAADGGSGALGQDEDSEPRNGDQQVDGEGAAAGAEPQVEEVGAGDGADALDDKKKDLCSECGLSMSVHVKLAARGKRPKKKPRLSCLRLHRLRTDPHQCSPCGKCGCCFETNAERKVHEYSYHPKEKQADIPCKVCDETFSSNSALVFHMRQDHPEVKPYSCDVCQEGFEDFDDVVEHRRDVHAKFRCDFCQMGFNRPTKLSLHVDSCPKRNQTATAE